LSPSRAASPLDGGLIVLDRELLEGDDGSVVGAGRGVWFFLGVGALIGLVLGILVSVTTDVPLAPEAGVLLGALFGWLFGRVSA
jgi:hypothetical protein